MRTFHMNELDEATLEIAVATLHAAQNNKAEAARLLGLPITTYKSRLKVAARRGMMGFEPVPEGFEVSRISHGPTGSHVQMKPERGDKFEAPQGHLVKGVSALVDGEGRIVQQWVKTKAGELANEALADSVRAAFEEYSPEIPNRPHYVQPDIMCVLPLPDLHVGLLAWEEETGENYDINIAREVLRSTIDSVIDAMPPSPHCLILGLGDLCHFDGYEARTERSGNFLDTDSRYPKVLRESLRLIKYAIDKALTRHDHVEVRLMAGNHDTRTALAVSVALAEGYANIDRVTIDDSPAYIWFKRYGKVMFGATHGDRAKAADMPMLMALDRPKDWAESTRRRIFTGHIHHERVREMNGVVVETLRSPVAKDAWHSFQGYRAGRSMYGYTFWLDGSRTAKVEFEI